MGCAEMMAFSPTATTPASPGASPVLILVSI